MTAAQRRVLARSLKTLTEFLDYDEAIARGSYREWTGGEWRWNDEVWRRGDHENWRMHAKARRAVENARVVLTMGG